MSPTEQTTVALETLRYLRSSPLMANHHAGLDAAIAALTAPAAEVPEALTDTDVARIFRRVYGGNRFDATERMFAAEIAAARDAQWQSTRLSGGVPDVDDLAQFIRQIDGNHRMGAGALAEHICEWLTAAPQAPAPEQDPVGEPYGYLYDIHYEDADGDPAGAKLDNFTRTHSCAKSNGSNVRAVYIRSAQGGA